MAVNDKIIQAARPQEKAYRIKDEHGLYLEIRPSGTKSWRLRYSFKGKPGIMTIGEYPLMSLKEARARRDDIRKNLMNGIAPSEIGTKPKNKIPTFAEVAKEWLKEQEKNGNHEKKYIDVMNGRLKNYILPEFGDKLIKTLTP